MAERLRGTDGRFVAIDHVGEAFLNRYSGPDGKLNILSPEEMDRIGAQVAVEIYQYMEEVRAAEANYLHSIRHVRFVG